MTPVQPTPRFSQDFSQTLSCARRASAFLVAALMAVLATALTATGAAAQSLDTKARNAIVIDFRTGAALLEKNADTPIPPASMSKLMTALMAFDALAQGRLSLEDRFSVSEAAYQKEGSKMFLNLTDRPSVEELLRGIIIQSGNDASIALAEALAGSERAFAEQMTQRAREIGMDTAVFANATGLPHPDHRMSVRDLAVLARYIIAEHPQYYGYYNEREYTWAGVTQRNRNPLLYLDIDGDGLKTGHTQEAGYGLVGSAARDGRRVIAVVAGLDTAQQRTREIERAMSWAFREFKQETIGKKGDIVGVAEIWLGEKSTTPLVLGEDLTVLTSWSSRGETTAEIVYEGPVEAPITSGQQLATLRLQTPGVGVVETPLYAAEAVGEGGYFTKLMAGISILADRAIEEMTQ